MNTTITATTTNVVGYYNPQNYPVQIYVTKIGHPFLLQKKGDYIRNQKGEKVNDPALEIYVGTNLARELSTTALPITTVPPRKSEGGGQHSIAAATHMKRDSQGNLTQVIFPTPVENTVPVSGNSVRGFSMKEAVRMGLAKPPPPPAKEVGAVERGTPFRADSLPELTSYAPTVEEKNAQYNSTPTPGGAVVEGFYKTLGAPMPNTMTLPQPNLPPEEVQSAPLPKAKKEKVFYTCPVCDKELKNRLGLMGHARFKHAAEYDAILAAYPKE